jgi:putative flippase GtrA
LSGGLGAGQASRSAAELYQRFRQLIHEGAKFLIVGGTGFVVVLAGSDALHFELGLGKFTSVTIATVVATVITFLGNRYWSFKDRQGAGARSETVLFFLLNGVGLLIQYACIFVVTDVIGLSGRIWYTFANFVGVGIGTLFRFWSYRKWIWVHPEVHLARLRRGRHRKGRTTQAPHQPVPHPAAAYQPVPYLQAHHGPTQPQPTQLQPTQLQPTQTQPTLAQPVPLAKRPVRPSGPAGGSNPLTQPMFAATHTQAPPADDTDRWIS